MIRKYDHIFFDLDHTLWDFPQNSRNALEETVQQFGFLPRLPSFAEFLEVYESVNEELWEQYRQKKIGKQKLTAVRFALSLEPFGITDLDSQQLNDFYLERMGEQTSLYPGTIETLEYLKKRGYCMHIITNGFREVQHRKLETSGLNRFIDRVFISEVVQSPKPERAIFEYALKSCNARKTRSIMIGDNWGADIIGALNFGIDQVMVLNGGKDTLPEEIARQIDREKSVFSLLQKRNTTWFVQEIGNLTQLL